MCVCTHASDWEGNNLKNNVLLIKDKLLDNVQDQSVMCRHCCMLCLSTQLSSYLVGILFGWSLIWSVSYLVGILFGWSLIWLVSYLVGLLFGWSLIWSVSYLVGLLFGRSLIWSVSYLVGLLFGWSLIWLVSYLVGLLFGQTLIWLVSYLVGLLLILVGLLLILVGLLLILFFFPSVSQQLLVAKTKLNIGKRIFCVATRKIWINSPSVIHYTII